MTNEFSTQRSFSIPEESGAPAPPQPGFDLKRMLFYRAPLMLGVFFTLAVPCMLAAWFLTPTEYEASATLQFLAAAPRIMARDSDSRGQPSYDKYVGTQIALLKNETILQRVVDDPAVAKSSVLAGLEAPLEFLKDNVDTTVERNSELVRISFRSADRDAARTIVAKIISVYLEYAASVDESTGGARMVALQKHRDSLQSELDRQIQQKADVARRIELPSSELAELGSANIDIQRDALVSAEEALAAVRSRLARDQETIVQLKQLQDQYGASPATPIYEFGIEDLVQHAPDVLSLRDQHVARETELANLRARLTEGSMRLKQAREEAATLQAKLDAAENAARGEALRSLFANREKEAAACEKEVGDNQLRVDEVNKRIDALTKEYEDRALKAASTSTEYEELIMRVAETQRLLGETREEITNLSLESSAAARVRLASEASVPNWPYRGKRFRLMGLALLGSLICGVGTGLLRELTDQHLRSAQDVRRVTALPVLASIPHFRDDRLIDSVRAHMVSADFPHSPMADAYRRILARIVYPPDSTEELASCLVASASRGDGKTAVACNIAVLLARANRRVLLVDTCGCGPSIEACFGLTPSRGLSEILFQGTTPSSVIRPTEQANLDVLGPGLRGEELSLKLTSREMTDFLHQSEQAYDHVIIDSVPSLLMSDAKLIAPIVDGVLVVIGADVSTRGMVSRCLHEMTQVSAEMIGIVMNGIRPRRGGYLKRNLDLYYRYSEGSETKVTYEEMNDLPEIRLPESEEELEPVVLLAATEESEAERGAQQNE